MPFVRWVGDLDPADVNPLRTRELIAAGKLTAADVFAFNAKRKLVIEGSSVKILGPNEGMSRWYQWGRDKGSYTLFVTEGDWKRIQALNEGRQFRLAQE
jgi:hypothetical protein